MNKWLLLLVACTFALPVWAEEFNAGIVRGIWFSNDTVFADTPTRMYVAIRNNTGSDLSGTVEFYVNSKRIERNNIDALDGRIIESWADWTPTYGTSTLSVTLSRTEISSAGTNNQAVELTSAITEEVIFVDYDTDGDGVGNATDQDDDSDGISDEAEIAAGSDPLDPNSPTQEPEPETDTNDAEAESADDTAYDQADNSDGPEGLEQFLSPSRADSAFSELTEAINQSKRDLDAYRDDRAIRLGGNNAPRTETQDSSTASSSDIDTNQDGFGEVTRSVTSPKSGDGWLDTIWHVIAAAFSTAYTFFLFLLSSSLSHPALLQLLLLILIVFILFKVAKRLASRPE